MDITCYGSSSEGNCYHVEMQGVSFLLDAGIRRKKLLKAGLSLIDIDAAFITHSHGDHAVAVEDLARAGIPLYMNEHTAFSYSGGPSCCSIRILKENACNSINDLRFMSFPLIHDVPCTGYFFWGTQSKERLLYITDTGSIGTIFSGVTHLMIEANHDERRLRESYANGNIDLRQYNHISCGHLSIESAIEYVRSSMSEALEAIYLIHLSSRHADEIEFKERMERATGVPTYIMKAGELYG